MVYAATGRAPVVAVGLGLFLAGSAALYNALDPSSRGSRLAAPVDGRAGALSLTASWSCARTATRTSS